MAKRKQQQTVAAEVPKVRNRVKQLKVMKPSELTPHPKNWRLHPDNQKVAMRGAMSRVGFAGAVIAYESGGKTIVIDGHERREEMYQAGDAPMPVLIVDLTEEEAEFLLVTYDPIGYLAEANTDMLSEMLLAIDADGNEDVQALVDEIAEMYSINVDPEPAEIVEDEIPEPPKDPVTKPGDLWLLGVYYECDTCGKVYDQAEASE